MTNPAYDLCCRMGDNTLILGHRISEWCGHAPVLEEDIALANMALDLIGQTQLWLGHAANLEGKGRTADDLAMLRDVWDFRNALLVEQPNGDFARTIMRQFLFDAWHVPMLEGLKDSKDEVIAGIAAKAVKEAHYHLDRSADLVIGLGDGTEESHSRMQAALDVLYPFAGELLQADTVDETIAQAGLAPHPGELRSAYEAMLDKVFEDATLRRPSDGFAHKGGKSGERHSEHLGHILPQMQWLQRAYPGAEW